MSKEIEHLLKPRYKVTRYPHYPFDGDVLIVTGTGELIHEEEGYPQSIYKIMLSDVEQCPHLFRKMSWWEDRKPEEMPGYVKAKSNCWVIDNYYPANCIEETKVIQQKDGLNFFEPATEQEYLTYQSSLK